jgi:hypothetical protein
VPWLRGKEASGKTELIASELNKLFDHLLAPLGVKRRPSSITDAIASYQDARDQAEERFGVTVSRDLEAAVAPAFAELPPAGKGRGDVQTAEVQEAIAEFLKEDDPWLEVDGGARWCKGQHDATRRRRSPHHLRDVRLRACGQLSSERVSADWRPRSRLSALASSRS